MENMRSEDLAWKIRRHEVEMTNASGASHIGSVLSVADIVAVLYADILRYRKDEPDWDERDRVILSKGHAGASIYIALAECGFFGVDELSTYCQNGSRLSGHVSHYVPGVDMSTGSLGQGLSAGAGMALAAKLNQKDYRVFVILGDGECDEGSVWEAALFANHFRLNNLVAIVDHNHMQSLDTCENTLELESLADKWASFGWNVQEINGNDHDQIRTALQQPGTKADRPTVIIANTVKGKGISFMENDVLWHYRFPHDGWEYEQAVTELHRVKPEGVTDIYTPNGIEKPAQPDEDAEIGTMHAMTEGYHPSFRQF